jgi:hypothetical protein
MDSYICLKNQIFSENDFKLVPVRYEDRFKIMQWRNEQIFHLRQNKPLTKNDQENYFSNTISKLFNENSPSQLLFSFLENDICIGYGGLVHISFIMNTSLEAENFDRNWLNYLTLIEQVAFNELGLHKMFTYAFDLRPHLYKVIERGGFKQDAVLNDHCLINGEYKNVVLHSKFNI